MSRRKRFDPLAPLKYKGYCWAHTPPGDKTTIDDFVLFAKFHLCKLNHTLWKDPIWDSYTNEEILVEYFAHHFSKSEPARKEFEADMDMGSEVYGEEIYDWLDRKIKENQEERDAALKAQPDKISFSPEGKDLEE